MGQMAIMIEFSGEFPAAEALVKIVQDNLGTAVNPVENLDNGYVLTIGSGDFAAIGILTEEKRIYVEVDMAPSHLQWSVVAALEQLGGRVNQPIPAFARRRLDDVTWWEKLQLKRRLGFE